MKTGSSNLELELMGIELELKKNRRFKEEEDVFLDQMDDDIILPEWE
ncbi:hypothetical protein SAMN05444483_101679 [Salegentibacter echinorum]|uniref:Uncharacterized protein n=1 Tax=Salegentibacter echinorum TaxID=1073325 RepID=A0A1M5CUT5_SALEC|nr:hypothetical protein SAMN05444483_101679 [Salegentibacter echinorum]